MDVQSQVSFDVTPDAPVSREDRPSTPPRRFCGPGCIVAAAFIGPGTVVSCTKAGAMFGTQLLWCITFAVLSAFVLQEASARIGLVTGCGLGEVLAQLRLPRPLRVILRALICLGIGAASALFEGGNVAGAAVGLANLLGHPEWEPWAALIVGSAVAAVIGLGGVQLVQNLMALVVAGMSIVFVLCAVLSKPVLSDVVISLFWPRLPQGSLTSVLSLIGTTIVTYNLFLQSSVVAKRELERRAEEGEVAPEVLRGQLSAMRLDTGSSMLMGGVINVGILVTAVYAFKDAEAPDTIAEMADALTRLGSAGRQLFFVGCLGAGLSSAITAPLAAQLTLGDVFGWHTAEHSSKLAVVWAGVIIFGTGLAFWNALIGLNAAQLVVFAQVFNAVLLPLVAGLTVFLAAREHLLGRFSSGGLLVALGSGSAVVTLVLSLVNLSKIMANYSNR